MSDLSDKLLRQAHQARREHRLTDAKRDLTKALDVCRTEGVRAALAQALTALGQIERDMNCASPALQHYEEAVGLYRTEGDRLRLAHTVRHVADIHREAGNASLAEPCYDEALSLYRNHPETSPLDLANTIRGLAILKSDAGETATARALWEEARDLYTARNVEAGVMESEQRLARLAGRG